MFNLGITEIIILGVIALFVIGPRDLPAVARQIARFLNDLKRATQDLSEPLRQMKEEAQQAVFDVHRKAREEMDRLEAELQKSDEPEESAAPPAPELHNDKKNEG